MIQRYEPKVRLDRLATHPENPRQGDVAAIAASIETNGFYGAVVAQKSSGHVLAGNHRLLAARERGDKTLPVIWIDVDDDRARRILLADNRTSDIGVYDDQTLLDLLVELSETDAHLEGTGYTTDDLEAMLGDLAGDDPDEQLGDTDDIPEPPAPTTVRGDVWLCGPHRVMCGNSTIPTDVEQLLDGARPDMVWTDPPYGVSYVGKTKDRMTISNDGADEFEAVLDGAFDSILTAARPGAPVYVAAPAGPAGVSFAQKLLDRGLFRQRLVWVKNALVLGHSDYHYRHEDIYLGYTPAPKGSGVLGRGGGVLVRRQLANQCARIRQTSPIRRTPNNETRRPDRRVSPQPPRRHSPRPLRWIRIHARSRPHTAPTSVPHGTRPKVRGRDLSPLATTHRQRTSPRYDRPGTQLRPVDARSA